MRRIWSVDLPEDVLDFVVEGEEAELKDFMFEVSEDLPFVMTLASNNWTTIFTRFTLHEIAGRRKICKL